MHIGYVPRERPPFSALNFRSGAYHFHKLSKNPFRSITILLFFGGFCRSGDHHFRNFFNFNPFIASHGRLSPRRNPRPFWRYAFSNSKRLELVPEPHIFMLDRKPVPEPLPIFHFAAAHTYQNLGGVPPPPRGVDPRFSNRGGAHQEHEA